MGPRRRTLLEAAASEAKRFGHNTPGPAHLAFVLAREAPSEFERVFGSGAERRLAAALQSSAPPPAADLASLLAGCSSDEPAALLALLVPYLSEPEPARPAEEDVPAVWSVGDVVASVYEVRAIAGKGGMGVVYRVHHREWGVDLAVKSPRPGYFESERQMAAFEHEARTWVDLGLHPNVCACHYVRRLGGIPRVFAEFADGGGLADQVRDRRLYAGGPEVALERLLDIAVQFAHGLAHAHSRGIVHQDVKPANVLLSAGAAKVADFGLARAAPAFRAGGDTAVAFGGLTPQYASPEQARAYEAGHGRVGRPTDVWSFAVSVLELFMGRVPHARGDQAARVLDAYLAGAPDPSIPALPHALADLLARCLLDDPRARPPMAEVAGELEEIYERVTRTPYARPRPEEARLLAGELSNRGLSMLDLGHPDEAERLWEEALAQDPHHPPATYNHGLYQWREARIADDELVRRLETVRRSHVHDWEDERLLALVHLERGDPDAAAELLDAAEALAGRVPDLRLAREDAAATVDTVARFAWAEGLPIWSVAVAADAGFVLAGLTNGQAALFDLTTRRARHVLEGHEGSVNVAMTPDAMHAATSSADPQIRVWDLQTGELVQAVECPTRGLTPLALTPDGRLLLGAGEDGVARLWNATTGTCLRELETGRDDLSAVALSADGHVALIVTAHDRAAQVWDVAGPRLTGWLDGHKTELTTVAVTPDGGRALTGSLDASARLWDVGTRRCLQTFVGHTDVVGSVALSADGAVAATAGWDGTGRVWDAATARCLRTIGGLDVLWVAVTPDRNVLLTAGPTGKVGLWRLRLERRQRSPFAYSRPRAAHEATEVERRVRSELDAVRKQLDEGAHNDAATRLRVLRETPGYERDPRVRQLWVRAARHGRRAGLAGVWGAYVLPTEASISAVALTPDGRVGMTAGFDGVLRAWNLRDGRCTMTIGGHAGETRGLALSPDGKRALTGGHDTMLRLWDLDEGRCLRTLEGHIAEVGAVALAPGGDRAVSVGRDVPVRIWDVERGICIGMLDGHTDTVLAVELSGDGRFALSGGRDRTARLWDLGDARCVRILEGHESDVHAVALSSDGSLAVTGSNDRTVCVWDLRSGDCTHRLPAGRAVFGIALTPDGALALSCGFDPTLRLWDISSGECLQEFKGHSQQVNSVALTADARLALSGGFDGSLRTWELDWDYDFAGA
jgi:WD40 repeat protein/serine/threonine protein kinase